MRGSYFYDEGLSTSSDDSNAAVDIRDFGEVFEAVDVSNNMISSAQEYRRSERTNNERTRKTSPLFIMLFKISFILLTVSIILLVAVFFFYPGQLGFSGATANANQSNNDVPILIVKDSSTQSPTLSPLANKFVHKTENPTPKPSKSETSEIPTSKFREPVQINIPQIISTSAPTLSPISIRTTNPTFQPTAPPPTRQPTTSRPTSAPTRTSITFYVLGDIPYNYDEELILSEQILAMPNDAEFVFHVGDIMRPKTTYCLDSAYYRVKQILLQSQVPVFITLGDNDWLDCPDQNLGLAYWQNNFHRFDRNWNHSLNVKRQSNRKENIAWVLEKILFMSVHVVGGSIYDSTEWYSRLNDDIEWIDYNINRHKHRVNVVVLFGHANPSNNLGQFFETLANISNDLGKPMLYIHGDGHQYYIKRVPFYDAQHIVDVQVDQGKNAPPLKVTVHNDATDPYDVFEFDRRISSP